MSVSTSTLPYNRAVVARHPVSGSDNDQYLLLNETGGAIWTADPLTATAFESMREAMRAALRLPASIRAFGLPLRSEVGARGLH